MSVMFAGIEMWVEEDVCNAEEGLVDTMQPPPAPCASALGVIGQLEAAVPLQAKGAWWEPISAPAMPIKIVDERRAQAPHCRF